MSSVNWIGPSGTTSQPTSGRWEDGTSWDTGSVPGADDTAYLFGSGAYVAQVDDGNAYTVAGLVVGRAPTLEIEGGSMLTASSSLSNASVIKTESGGTFAFGGSVSNNGLILDASSVVIGTTSSSSTTLSGGRLELSDDSSLSGGVAGSTLENVSATIDGYGRIFGGAGLTITNDVNGVVDADAGVASNGAYPELSLDTGNAITNYGVLEATAGDLVLYDTVHNISGGTASDPRGIIAAYGNGFVELEGCTVQGGLLVTTGAGNIFIRGSGPNDGGSGDATLDGTGAAVTIDGTVYVDDSADLMLRGSIVNVGEIELEANSGSSNIDIDSSTVTLSGKGKIMLSAGDGVGDIDAISAGNTLISANTIEGAGNVGDGRLVLDNQGTIEGLDISSSANGIAVLLGQAGITTASINEAGGVMEAGAGSTLVIETPPSNPNAPPIGYLTNDGIIRALAGGTVVIVNTVLTNIDGNGTMTGGTLAAYAGATLDSTTFGVVSDAGTIILSGAKSVIEASSSSSSTPIEQSLTDIAKGGILEVIAKRSYTTSNSLTLEGRLDLGGGAFRSGTITMAAGSLLFGDGIVTARLAQSGTIEALGGTLDIRNVVSGKGREVVKDGATLEFDAAVASTQAVSFAGTHDMLLLKDVAGFKGTVAGLVATDTIDLAGLSITGTKAYYTPNSGDTGGTLIVKNATTRDVLTLDGQFVASGFHVAKDSAGTGTDVTYTPPDHQVAGLAIAHT